MGKLDGENHIPHIQTEDEAWHEGYRMAERDIRLGFVKSLEIDLTGIDLTGIDVPNYDLHKIDLTQSVQEKSVNKIYDPKSPYEPETFKKIAKKSGDISKECEPQDLFDKYRKIFGSLADKTEKLHKDARAEGYAMAIFENNVL